jgi:uncharacterized membrane protein YhhN
MRGLGYLISIISVLLLGAVAWPAPDEPRWHVLALLAGMSLSMLGMGLRWGASRQQKTELHQVERTIGLRQPAE